MRRPILRASQKSYWKPRNRNSCKRKLKRKRLLKSCDDRKSWLLRERKPSIQPDNGNVAKEVVVTGDVDVEVSSLDGRHPGLGLHRLVANDHHRDQPHVVTWTHMFPPGLIAAVYGTTVAPAP